MKNVRHALLAAISLSLAAQTSPAQTTGFSPESFGILKGMPAYIQEWHVWWGLPYPDPNRPQAHLDTTMTASLEPWRLNWDRNGYPLPGIYDSFNPDIIRWQMRCIKATGLDSVAVMLHPDMEKGLVFIQEHVAKNTNGVQLLLDIAAEEKFPIFFMDEVAFRKGNIAQDPAVMTQRAIRFLKQYGSHPGFYKIDHAPVYYYQTWGYWVGAERTSQMMRDVQAAAGPVYWMAFGDANKLKDVPEVKTIVGRSSINHLDPVTRQHDGKMEHLGNIIAMGRSLNKKVGEMVYPKFDGTGQPWRQQNVKVYGDAGRTLEREMLAYVKHKPQMVMFTSWNDYEEGAGIEPAWDYDGFADDPYLYCKMVAHLRGVEFVPPPLPPKSAVHPTIWEKLGYGDGAGPILDRVRRTHVRGGSIEVVARDTLSAISELEVAWDGDAYWIAPQTAGGSARVSGMRITEGKLDKIVSPESAMTRLGARGNAPSFSIGRAAIAEQGYVRFSLTAAAKLGDKPTFGVAYPFEFANLFPGVSLVLPRKESIDLIEPVGGKSDTLRIAFQPHNKPGDFNGVMEGWRAAAAMPPCPTGIGKPEATITLQTGKQSVGILSVLGNPKPERCVPADRAEKSTDATRATFYVPIPSDRLAKPGAHFVWLRARDAAGNWGSPVLYAVPNYEQPEPKPEKMVRESFTPPVDAVFADSMSSLKNWTAISGPAGSVELREDLRYQASMSLGNGVSVAKLPKPTGASWTAQFKMAHMQWRRSGIIWFTNESGNKGCGVMWDSAAADQNEGQGRVSLLRLNQETEVAWATEGQRMSERMQSGRNAVEGSLAEFTLAYDAAKKSITLQIDGRTLCTLSGQDLEPIARVYLRGNDRVVFDDLVILNGAQVKAQTK